MKRLIAQSISRSIRQRIEAGSRSECDPAQVQVLAVFARACNLVTAAGDVVALVLPEIGNGPLNIVVEEVVQGQRPVRAGVFRSLESGMAGRLGQAGLQVGQLEVDLEGARVWEPRPAWEWLCQHRGIIEGRLQRVYALALRQAPEGSVLGVLSPDLTGIGKPVRSGMATIREASQQLKVGWAGDRTALQAGASRVAGLGGGLTPAGDDFLAGAMLWAWLAHSEPERFCDALLEASAGRTTTLAAAFLQAAAGGECSAAWHRLLDGLADGDEGSLDDAVREVVSLGHTSGADMLAGFLWMSL